MSRPIGIALIVSNKYWKFVRYSSRTVWSYGDSTREKIKDLYKAGAAEFFSTLNLSRSLNIKVAVTILTDLILSLEFFLNTCCIGWLYWFYLSICVEKASQTSASMLRAATLI